jgi:flavin-dependent dehydrogenase
MTPDAVVIGGGPAGTSAAIRLARSGRRVRLYEKARFPRAKLCGGFLSFEGLADLEDLNILKSLRACSVPLHRSIIAPKRGQPLESLFPKEALSISRDVLDTLLLEETRNVGVDVREGEDGFANRPEAPCTVIAAGRMGSPAEPLHQEHLTPWYAASQATYFGIQALFKDVDDVTDQVELDLVDSGYVGLSRQRAGVNVCALTTPEAIQKWGPSLDKVLMHFTQENSTLRSHFKEASRLGNWMAVGPVKLGIRRLTAEGTFYVGDAACVIDPFAGEGMAMALYGSKLLLRALGQDHPSPQEEYARLWKKAFLPSLRWNAFARALYSIPLFREPSQQILGWFPQAIQWLTDLTRYRRIEFI